MSSIFSDGTICSETLLVEYRLVEKLLTKNKYMQNPAKVERQIQPGGGDGKKCMPMDKE